MIKLKRDDETSSREDGFRILVERRWPRGVGFAAADLERNSAVALKAFLERGSGSRFQL